MNLFKAIAVLTLLLSTAPMVLANVYTWTDEKGVKHYSNVAPPESVKEIHKAEEIPADPSAADNPLPPATEAVKVPSQSNPRGTRSGDQDAKTALDKLKNPEKVGESATEKVNESTPPGGEDVNQLALPQGEIVSNEKAHLKKLQIELEEDSEKREQLIASEEKRLMQALDTVRRTPTSQFGSSRNKDRQVGYYQYRLEALQNSPDTYFDYADSDAD